MEHLKCMVARMSQDYPMTSVQINDREFCLPPVGIATKRPSLCPLYIGLQSQGAGPLLLE